MIFSLVLCVGHEPYKVTFSSDNFDQLYKWAIQLIKRYMPYSQKIWRFGGMTLNRQIKIRQNFYHVHVCMAILYHTTKFKSANTVFGAKPPNLMTANIFGYGVYSVILNQVAVL